MWSQIWPWGRIQLHKGINGSCPFSSCSEATQISLFLYVSGTFWVAALLLDPSWVLQTKLVCMLALYQTSGFSSRLLSHQYGWNSLGFSQFSWYFFSFQRFGYVMPLPSDLYCFWREILLRLPCIWWVIFLLVLLRFCPHLCFSTFFTVICLGVDHLCLSHLEFIEYLKCVG